MTECEHSYFTSVTTFITSYVNVPDDFYESSGILTKKAAQACVQYLIDMGVFENAEDVKKSALKEFQIILPYWIFEYEKE